MAQVPDGPIADTRPPGFGCTLSYGMLGPSRVLLRWADAPTWCDELREGVVIGHSADSIDHPLYTSGWLGHTDQCAFNMGLSAEDLDAGLWVLSLAFTAVTVAEFRIFQRLETNFEWVRTPITLTNPLDAGETLTVRRLAEWEILTDRYPLATKAELA